MYVPTYVCTVRKYATVHTYVHTHMQGFICTVKSLVCYPSPLIRVLYTLPPSLECYIPLPPSLVCYPSPLIRVLYTPPSSLECSPPLISVLPLPPH